MRAFSLLIALLLSACGDGDDRYFPLAKGKEWRYQQRLELAQETTKSDFVLRNLGEVKVDGLKLMLREDGDGNQYGIALSKDKIERVASKSIANSALERDSKPITVLKLPLTKGSQWTNSTLPFILRRVSEFPPELKHNANHRMTMEFEVQSLDATVKVAAGEYTDCAHVVGKAALKLYIDPVAGFSEVPITQEEWYCPKVGLVKLIRKEPVKSRFLMGGEIELTLVNFKD